MRQKILIVDDDLKCLKFIETALKFAGYSVIETDNGDDAIQYATESLPDVIILDWMLPDISGIEVCKILRTNKKTKFIPIIMLTAKTKIDDKITGLEAGVDEYITKPIRKDEIIAHVKAVLRRVEYSIYGRDEILKNGSIRIYPDKQKITVKGKEVKLTKKEYDLLYLLLIKQGRVLSRDYLLETVWGWDSESFPRTLDTHIYSLRKKIGTAGNEIITVKGIGYKFAEE